MAVDKTDHTPCPDEAGSQPYPEQVRGMVSPKQVSTGEEMEQARRVGGASGQETKSNQPQAKLDLMALGSHL